MIKFRIAMATFARHMQPVVLHLQISCYSNLFCLLICLHASYTSTEYVKHFQFVGTCFALHGPTGLFLETCDIDNSAIICLLLVICFADLALLHSRRMLFIGENRNTAEVMFKG